MKKTLVVVGISVLVSGLFFFGLTVWTFAQSNNIINACVAKDGSIRIVALEGQCKSKETPLNWNIQGEPGPPGLLGFYTVTSETEVPRSSFGFGTEARCDLGDMVTGGGWSFLDPDSGAVIGVSSTGVLFNRPVEAGDGLGEGWMVDAFNNSPFDWTLEVSAICADLTP